MRLPRLRLTLRRMMAIVALVALSLVFVLPAGQRTVWLYKNSASTRHFDTSIHGKPASSEAPQANPAYPTYAVGRPFALEVTSSSIPAPWLPDGLNFRGDVEVKITDSTTFTTVYENKRRSRRLVTGSRSSEGEHETSIFAMTPSKPGAYAVRYEQHITDLFGRTHMGACGTMFFNAR